MTFDYQNNSVIFTKNERQMTLKGITEGSKLKYTKVKLQMITAIQWYKTGLQNNCCAIGRMMNNEKSKEEAEIPITVKEVQKQY